MSARYVAQQLLLKPLVWSLVDVHVHGKERLKKLEDPFIVVANHSSHLDGPLIIGSLPQRLSRYLATGVAADYFFDHWYRAVPTALFFNAFPIERERGLRGQSQRGRRGLAGHLINDGVPLLVFPEGTRSKTKAMGTFKPGPAALCISRNVPALPIALVGSGLAMPRDTGWPKRGRPPVHIVFGDPTWPRPGEGAHQLTHRLADTIRKLHDDMAVEVGLPLMSDYERDALAEQAAGQTSGPDQIASGPAQIVSLEQQQRLKQQNQLDQQRHFDDDHKEEGLG